MNPGISYIPRGEANSGIWFSNFSTKIAIYAVLLGITPAEVTMVHNDYAMYQYILNLLQIARQTVQNLTTYKNQLKHAVGQQHIGAVPTLPAMPPPPTQVAEGVFDRVSKLVKRIKASPNYTDNIGQDLGIIVPDSVVDVSSLQPELKVKLDAGRPHIKANKGIADAFDLYVDRKDGAGFHLLGRLLKLDYIDTFELPAGASFAEWDYKGMYVIGNDNVGLMSAVVSIIVKKM